jgi:general secretion pathway protein A
MYFAFFGLKREPFSIAPDPRYLYMSERHREALAHLLYGVNGGGGFVLLSGEIGAGKTTVCRCFLEQIPKRCNVAYIFNPKLTVLELLGSVCHEFGIPVATPQAATIKDYLALINEYLLKTHAVGQNNVLIIDEAQMLSSELLEQLRLLTNLETNERKLLQILLIGQPELRDMLAQPELEQLAQRVIARFHLGALSAVETRHYIHHRLAVAGLKMANPFDERAVVRIYQLTRGVPRRINLLCDRSLLGAYATGQNQVSLALVNKAAQEVFGDDVHASVLPTVLAPLLQASQAKRPNWLGLAASAGVSLLVALSVLGAWMAWSAFKTASAKPAVAASAAASSARVAVGRVVDGSAVAGSASSAVVASTPAKATTAELLASLNAQPHTENDAWRELALAWKVSLPSQVEPCAAAARSSLSCFRNIGTSLALIRLLERPGILVLRPVDAVATDAPLHAILLGLTPQTATLRLGNTTQTVALSTLNTLWRGEFLTLWQTPPAYKPQVVDSSAGEMANWVSQQLAQFQDPNQPTDARIAGAEAWRVKVATFQRSQGLKADGLAGPTTLMQLNRAAGIDEPRLRTAY